ncbi:MAG: hypothetical protein ACYC91_02860 [Solirubrobacteraceae bacterium]
MSDLRQIGPGRGHQFLSLAGALRADQRVAAHDRPLAGNAAPPRPRAPQQGPESATVPSFDPGAITRPTSIIALSARRAIQQLRQLNPAPVASSALTCPAGRRALP